MVKQVRKIHFLLTASERKRGLGLLGLMVVGMALEMLCTGLIIPAIALMTQEGLTTSYPQLQPILDYLGNPTQAQLIVNVMAGLVGIYLVKNLFLAFLAWRQTRFAYGVQADLSQRLFTTYLHQPYTFHLQRNSAQLIRNVTTEVGIFADVLIKSLNIATELLVLLGISTLLLIVEPLGTLIAVIVLGGAAWTFYYFTRARVVRWGKWRQLHDGLRLQHLQQGLGGAKDAKLLGRESTFLQQYRVHNTQSARVGQFQATLQMLPRLWLELLAVVGLATLVITMLAQGRELATIMPTLGLFAAAAFRLMPSVNRTLSAAQALRYSLTAVNTLYDELEFASVETAGTQKRRSTAIPTFQTDIRLVDVRYIYPSAATPALDGLTLCIRRGESAGFVGPSGSGKSTLVDVILGLLTPCEGKVLVDGRNIQEDLRTWQDQIGYVPQSIYLTDDTLRRNVAFGLPDEAIDDDAVRRAIGAAQLEDFVAGLPKRLDTLVGERGIRLSGGQRQRIGIARALYHDPAVLVLDEATSALDTATERGVMEAVTALQGSKTILIVAHRLSTVGNCDRLYRLEQGRIVAESVPAEVLRPARIAGQTDAMAKR
jgi:ABC-type multidrug transport system fused ATPase/permease subunit